MRSANKKMPRIAVGVSDPGYDDTPGSKGGGGTKPLKEQRLEIDETEEYFGVLYPYICDDEVTDIDFNGTDVWLSNSRNERYKSDLVLTDSFVEAFTTRVANAVSKPFHKQQPILEAETPRLRITIVHESVAISGRTICIRKSLPYVRLNEDKILREHYCSVEILSLLKNCIRARNNIVFCGEPGVGKTECAKFFSQYIPANERVITIEDNPEWHYKEVNPDKDCVELRVNDKMDYTAAIKTCLRLNPKWMMLSESRSTEILKLIEGFSTGVRGITTLHTDDVRKVPDRMVNMSGQGRNEGRMENDIYSFIDLAVLIRRREERGENGAPAIVRYIDQICYFERVDHENRAYMIVEDGDLISKELPQGLRDELAMAGIVDVFEDHLDGEDKIMDYAKKGLAISEGIRKNHPVRELSSPASSVFDLPEFHRKSIRTIGRECLRKGRGTYREVQNAFG